MQVFEDFPKEIIFLDEIDIGSCVLEDSKTTIDVLIKQVWEGSKSILDLLKKIGGLIDKDIANNQCVGVKDILMDWEKQGIKTFIFYTPRATTKAIRTKLSKKVKTKVISEKIESYIRTQCKRDNSIMSIYSLDNEDSSIESIFDISALKKEFDQDSKVSEKIYFIGLKYNLNTNEVNTYLNNIPIREESGLIIGDSKILRHKLKKGYMSIEVDDGIEIEFFDTNEFSSTDEDIGVDLQDIDFEEDSLTIELDKSNSPLTLESIEEKSLIFSREHGAEYENDNGDSSTASNELVDRTTKVNLDTFFIPNSKDLKSVNLLLLKKNGQKILAGGQYHSGLSDCDVLANIFINLEEESITVTNHSNDELSFSNYEDDFWRLEESTHSPSYNSGIYTEILTETNNITDERTEFGSLDIEANEIIKKGGEYTFKINEIEFNDSNVSFDKSGVLIRYSSFCIAEFKKEFFIHRTAYKMSDSGTMVDCFVNQLSKGVFKYGARVYDNSSSILGIIISSQPIRLKQISEGLEIDATALVARGYTVQISAASKKYMLKDKYNAKKTIKKNEMKNLEIEVIHKRLKKPLIEFSLEFD